MSVKVFGLKEIERIPGTLAFQFLTFKRELALLLLEDFRRNEPKHTTWPKGTAPSRERKSLQQLTHAIVRGNRIVVGTFRSGFAKALDRGWTSKPKKKKVMRFLLPDRSYFFTKKPQRHAGKHFFERILAQAPAIVEAAFARAFGGSPVARGRFPGAPGRFPRA